MTLHVSLPKELEKMVHTHVQSGMYGSASEVVREALRDFFEGMANRQIMPLSELKEEMQKRRRKALAGEAELIDGETAFAELARKYGLDE
jgi:antitoxin ParD1/3/4